MNFTKKGYFTLGGKKYKILSHGIYEKRFEKYKDHPCNAVDFIQVVDQTEMNETVEVEVRPEEINTGKELNEMQKIHNEYVRICGTKVYPKTFLYSLIEKGELIIL